MSKQILSEFLSGNSEVTKLFVWNFRENKQRLSAVEAAARRSVAPSILKVLRDQNPTRIKLVELLGRSGTTAVIAGQQIGVLGGPIFTLYKILTAIKAAAALEQESGVKTVPIFWMQSEDHDYAEIKDASFLTSGEQLKSVSLLEDQKPLGGSVGRFVLSDSEAQSIATQLETILSEGRFEFGSTLLKLARESYAAGVTLAAACSNFFEEILKDLPILIFNPDTLEVKEEVREFIASSFLRAFEIEKHLSDRAAIIQGLGLPVQVQIKSKSPLFFLTLDGKRVRLEEGKNGVYQAGTSTVSKQELFDILHRSPDLFTSSALIRPLLQDRLFPTAAYISGPSEFNYWAQIQPLYKFFNLTAPITVPRAHFTVIDRAAARLIEKSGVEPTMLDRSAVQLVAERMQGSKLDPNRVFGELESGIASAFDSEIQSFDEIGGEVLQALATTKQAVAANLQKFRGKYERALLQKEGTLTSQVEKLRQMIFPGGREQERVLSVAHFIAMFGEQFPNAILNAIDPWNSKMRFISPS